MTDTTDAVERAMRGLQIMLQADIAREGRMHSFMINAGLLDRILTHALAYTPKPASDNIGGAVPEGLRAGLDVALDILEADLEQAKETSDADWIGQSTEAYEALRAMLAASPSPQGKPSLDGESGK